MVLVRADFGEGQTGGGYSIKPQHGGERSETSSQIGKQGRGVLRDGALASQLLYW